MAKKKQASLSDIPTFKEVVSETREPLFEGEKSQTIDLLNKEIVILQVSDEFKSSFYEGNYVVIQAKLDDKLITVAIAGVLLKQVKELNEKKKLPVRATIIRPKGKRYYTLS